MFGNGNTKNIKYVMLDQHLHHSLYTDPHQGIVLTLLCTSAVHKGKREGNALNPLIVKSWQAQNT